MGKRDKEELAAAGPVKKKKKNKHPNRGGDHWPVPEAAVAVEAVAVKPVAVDVEPPQAKKKRRKEVELEEDDHGLNLKMPKAAEPEERKSKKEEKVPAPPVNNSLRVFVSGIPRTIDEATLKKDFEECGEIANIKLMLDGQTWMSRGIAFITFKDEKGLNAALEFHGDDYGGRKLSVKKAEAQGSSNASGPGEMPVGCLGVVLKKLSPEVTQEDLEELFANPKLVRVGLLMDKTTGKSRCTARIDFKEGSNGPEEAMKHSSASLRGRKLEMQYCQPPKAREW